METEQDGPEHVQTEDHESQLKVHDVGSIACRICLQNSNETLISPCCCKGTQRFIHRSCLEHWLSLSMRRNCELCSYQFRVTMQKRYRWWQSIVPWFTQSEIRYFILSDTLLLAFITMLSAMACSMSVTNLNIERKKKFKSRFEMVWTIGTCVLIIMSVMFLYLITIVCFIKPKVNHWYSWWKNNVIVVLNLENENEDEYKTITIPSVTIQYI